MVKLVCLLFLASLAYADKVVVINKQIDEGLKIANSIFTKQGYGLTPLPSHKFQDIELKNGVHVGFNSLQRSADATLTTAAGGKNTFDLHIGWNLFATAYGSIKTQGLEFSGVVKVRDSSFRITYEVEAKPCKVNLIHLEYERLADAQFSGSLPETDKDISDVFANHVVPYINEKCAKVKDIVERVINGAICHPRGVQASQNHVTIIATTLADVLLDV